ncbi:Bax inhibitor-1/YccA family protein [Euzebya sp.]|uniref:Bax inhibitor-1/YccA family protein n=1 Tax=Euzebya sp. TaxID=1971409 RepID=UPI003515E8E3
MRTSNPTLSSSAFNRLGASQGGAVASGGYGGGAITGPNPVFTGESAAPPFARTDAFTVEGAIYKTGALLAILAVAALAAGALLPESAYYPALIGGVIAGLVLVVAISVKPNLAPALAPAYALVEGVVIGVVTVVIESQPGLDGIATQAAIGTIGVLAVMLTLYRTGVIKVTQRFRMVVLAATGAIFLTYLASFVLGFFGVEFGFLHGNSMLSIGISVVIIGVAALNLALDFDFIENAARAGLPAKTEWYAAFGLLVTLVWLYLEILRLLAKLQSRD